MLARVIILLGYNLKTLTGPITLFSGYWVASVARPMIAVYLRFRDICIYVCVCLHMHCTRPCTTYTSPNMLAHCALYFETLAAVRSTTLKSPPFARYGQRRQFSWRQPGQWQGLSRTHTATGHRKCGSSQTAAQREEWLAAERLRHIFFKISSLYYTSFSLLTYIHTFRVSFLVITSLNFINCCMVEVRSMCLRKVQWIPWNCILCVQSYV